MLQVLSMNALLKQYFPVADLIAGTFGQECEVVVHDLEQPEESVVYVANGTVTGRKIGQSFDHLVRNVLMNEDFRDDKTLNYVFETADGRKIRSSTLLLRDADAGVIGALCINYDLSRYLLMQASLNAFLGGAEAGRQDSEREPEQDVSAIIDDLILKIIGPGDAKNLTRKRCVELVRFMDEKGVFLVKGAIDKVAGLMGVSRVTIYSYLDEAKGKR